MAQRRGERSKTSTARTCAFCGSSSLSEIIDFGRVALAGGFLKKAQISKEKKYPLTIVFCNNCYAVQVRDHVDPEILFATDYYFSSAIKTLRDHFTDYASEVTGQFLKNPKKAVVVEFGCNDGVLLKPLADQGVGTVIGVDPAKNIIGTIRDDRLVLVNDFFNKVVADSLVKNHGKADLVMANNTFAHISDINGTTEAVQTLLSGEGVFIFEVHYLGNIIEGMQYDMMYHEHIYYYSLLALQNHLARHGLVIFDLKQIPVHGGSVRYYAAKKGSRRAKNISVRVKDLQKQEKELGYDKKRTYVQFASRVEGKKIKLMALLQSLKKEGKSIVGYGASGRANTVIQYCKITSKHLDFMIDDSPVKQGLYTPGSHLLISNSSALKTVEPDYILLFAWTFFDEIASKNTGYLENGGRIIAPLPEVRITMHSAGLKD